MAEKLDLVALEKLADAARECLQSGKHWMRIEERAVMVEKLAQLAIAGLRAQHAGEAEFVGVFCNVNAVGESPRWEQMQSGYDGADGVRLYRSAAPQPPAPATTATPAAGER